MDLNLVVLAGKLAATPEIRGDKMQTAQYLVIVYTEIHDGTYEPKRRLDVVPVIQHDPDARLVAEFEEGDRVWIAGRLQRRFYAKTDGRRSRMEVVAHQIVKQPQKSDSRWAVEKMQHDLLPSEGANE